MHYGCKPNCGGEGLATTVKKHVACPECQKVMGADMDSLNGFHFPATKFVDLHSHDEISDKIVEEVSEFCCEDEGTVLQIAEAYDIIQACETKLRKWQKEGKDIEAAKLIVFNRCRERGYYANDARGI